MGPLDARVHRWSLDDFHRLKGVPLLHYLRCELISGELLELADAGGTLHGGPHRWTYDEYLVLCESFPELNVELFDGELVDVPRPSPGDVAVGAYLARRLIEAFANAHDGYVVKCRPALHLDYQTALRPAVAVLFHPPMVMGQKEWLLVVDVGNGAPGAVDEMKLQACARHRVAEHWRVDLSRREIVAHRHPRRDWRTAPRWEYGDHSVYARGEEARIMANSTLRMPVDDILNPT